MNERSALSLPGKLNVAGLVVAAAGILIQVLSGVDEYPAIPPGLIILLVVAGVVALGSRWRWTPMIGVALPLYLTVGAFVTPGTADRLAHPGEVGAFVGTAVQMLGLVTALIAGLVATTQNYRTRTTP